MKSVRLYQIPFSHYCDKVRWTLDYFEINYEKVNYSQSNRKEFRRIPKEIRRLFPLIEEENVHNERKFISDSTPILIYLDKFNSTNSKNLFPENEKEKEKIIEYCLMLDTDLGLSARRLAYLYLITECPHVLSSLIDGNYSSKRSKSFSTRLKGFLISMILIARFRLDQIVEENLYEKTIRLLDRIEKDFQGKSFLFSNRFTAADLTLTSLIYPLKLVPSIRCRYSNLFDLTDQIRSTFDPNKTENSMNLIENSLLENRKKEKNLWEKTLDTFSFRLFSTIDFVLKPLTRKFSSNQFEYLSSDEEVQAKNDQRILLFRTLKAKMKFILFNSLNYFVQMRKQIEFIEKTSIK